MPTKGAGPAFDVTRIQNHVDLMAGKVHAAPTGAGALDGGGDGRGGDHDPPAAGAGPDGGPPLGPGPDGAGRSKASEARIFRPGNLNGNNDSDSDGAPQLL